MLRLRRPPTWPVRQFNGGRPLAALETGVGCRQGKLEDLQAVVAVARRIQAVPCGDDAWAVDALVQGVHWNGHRPGVARTGAGGIEGMLETRRQSTKRPGSAWS